MLSTLRKIGGSWPAHPGRIEKEKRAEQGGVGGAEWVVGCAPIFQEVNSQEGGSWFGGRAPALAEKGQGHSLPECWGNRAWKIGRNLTRPRTLSRGKAAQFREARSPCCKCPPVRDLAQSAAFRMPDISTGVGQPEAGSFLLPRPTARPLRRRLVLWLGSGLRGSAPACLPPRRRRFEECRAIYAQGLRQGHGGCPRRFPARLFQIGDPSLGHARLLGEFLLCQPGLLPQFLESPSKSVGTHFRYLRHN